VNRHVNAISARLSLRTHQRERLSNGSGIVAEERPENYLVRVLMDFDDISYDDHAE